MVVRMTPRELATAGLAKAIYLAWMKDERWGRADLAAASKNTPVGFFWAEIAARAVNQSPHHEAMVRALEHARVDIDAVIQIEESRHGGITKAYGLRQTRDIIDAALTAARSTP